MHNTIVEIVYGKCRNIFASIIDRPIEIQNRGDRSDLDLDRVIKIPASVLHGDRSTRPISRFAVSHMKVIKIAIAASKWQRERERGHRNIQGGWKNFAQPDHRILRRTAHLKIAFQIPFAATMLAQTFVQRVSLVLFPLDLPAPLLRVCILCVRVCLCVCLSRGFTGWFL